MARLVAALPVLALLLAFFAVVAYSQENVTVTVTIPGVEITSQPSVTVTAYYLNETTLKVTVSCMAYGRCPDVVVTVGWNGTIYHNGTVSLGNCTGSCTQSVLVRVPGGVAWLYYRFDGTEYNETIVYSVYRESDVAAFVMGVAIIGLLISAAVRSSPVAAATGLVLAALFAYYAAVHGYAPSYVVVATYIAVLAGAIILLVTMKG